MLRIRLFLQMYILDIILCGISFFGVILYILSFRMTYPSKIPNLDLISSSDMSHINLYDLIESEGMIHITIGSTTGFRNLQNLQRFAFTNKDISIIDLYPVSQVHNSQNEQFRKNFKTFENFEIPEIFLQNIPLLLYIDQNGTIQDYHIGQIEYSDLLHMTSRDK